MEKIGREKDGKFKKGVSANPKGRPSGGSNYTDCLKRVLLANEIDIILTVEGEKKHLNIKSNSKDFYEAVAAVQIVEMLKGNQQANKEVMNRLEPVVQKVEQTNINKLDGVNIEFID
jgi:hypothetical protein